MVLAAGNHSDEAMAGLCKKYWYPLYAFLRRKGYNPHDAEDYTQGFFAECLGKDRLKMADRDRGKFRSFLLASLQNFVANAQAKEGTRKRGGKSVISLSEEGAQRRYDEEPCHDLSPEQLFERRWALAVLEQAMERLRLDYERAGQRRVFELLRVFLSGEKATSDYPKIARNLEISEGAVRVAVHRLRQQYGRELRAVVADSLGNPGEVDDELRYLLSVLSQ